MSPIRIEYRKSNLPDALGNDETRSAIRNAATIMIVCYLASMLTSCDSPPTITKQPQNVTVNAGASAIFTVEATGTSVPSYQWMLNGVAIPGATSGSYTITSTSVQQSGGEYSVLVINSYGSVTSAAVRVTVNTSPSATTVAAVSTSLSSASPKVNLPNIAAVDFTGQTGLYGQVVSLAQIIDSHLNALATDRQAGMDADLSDVHSLQIAVPVPPTGSVMVAIHAPSAISRLSDNSATTLYVYSTPEDSGDGEEEFIALPASVDIAAKTITVNIPGGYFQPTPSGTYIEYLKIGIAVATASPATPVRLTSPKENEPVPSAGPASTGISIPSIPCPVAPSACIERSRFNPGRYLKGSMRPHYGVDLVAAVGTALYVPKNGSPTTAFTQKQYDAAVANLTCTSKECAEIGGYAGISLTIKYSNFYLRLIHLSSLDPSVLNSDGTLNNRSVTTSSGPVAYSGNTGSAMLGGPHLHYELITSYTKICEGSKCKYVSNRIDPFPSLVTNVTVRELSNKTTLILGDNYSFVLEATDGNRVPVLSDVHDAAENGGIPPQYGLQPTTFRYDPTRKICISPGNPNVLDVPKPDNDTTFAGKAFGDGGVASYCSPWITRVTTIGLADNPTTSVTVEFSKDATLAVAADPLSDASATWTLTGSNASLSVEWMVTPSPHGNDHTWSGNDTLTITNTNWVYKGSLSNQGPNDPCIVTRTEAGSGQYTFPKPPTPPKTLTFFLAFPAKWTNTNAASGCENAGGGNGYSYGGQTGSPGVTIIATPTGNGAFKLSTDTVYPPNSQYGGAQLTVTATGYLR